MPDRIARRRREEFSIRPTEEDLIRVAFDRENDHIERFSVQYLAFLQNEWRPIVHFDTAHGRAHMDISHPDGSQDTRELYDQDYGAALSWVIRKCKPSGSFIGNATKGKCNDSSRTISTKSRSFRIVYATSIGSSDADEENPQRRASDLPA